MTNLVEYVAPVYRFARRLARDHYEAEDITQETFLRAWRHVDRLREERATRTWLFRIAANLWRDRQRRGEHAVARAGPIGDEIDTRAAPPDEIVATREEVHRAVQAMDALPPRQREVLYLHACEGLAYDEIATVLDITPENVKASLSLARKKMRERLPNLDD